jgi:hypothetical protein
MHYMHIKFNCSTYIYSIKILQQKIYQANYFTFLPASSPCLLSGVLLLLGLLIPLSVDIPSKCIVILPSLLKFFLGYRQFLF